MVVKQCNFCKKTVEMEPRYGVISWLLVLSTFGLYLLVMAAYPNRCPICKIRANQRLPKAEPDLNMKPVRLVNIWRNLWRIYGKQINKYSKEEVAQFKKEIKEERARNNEISKESWRQSSLGGKIMAWLVMLFMAIFFMGKIAEGLFWLVNR